MDSKTATERLRELLDERGVEHSDHYLSTIWRDGHGILHLAGEPMADGSLVVDMLTPEQAIAATLGCDRDEVYDAGFANGVKATLQQLDGLLMQTDSAVEIQAWVDRQWEEEVV